ncbi:MAG: MoxR family ATPase [Firmicutes bacterium]|nr:MoxR family ATPase [Bacillota bacterium]
MKDFAEAGIGSRQKSLTKEEIESSAGRIGRIIANIEKVILGKHSMVELTVLALICGGHVLIEDVPGVGKTSLVSALAKTVSCDFNRIQFTPDVMPSDITGFSVYNQKTGEFEFRAGAVISNIVLADEINRASAKTQSSLLEAMEEKQVTVDTQTYTLPEPFMVLATQNPIDSFGTYPLPEAQIDRFLMKLSIGYPSLDEEINIALHVKEARAALESVTTGEEVLELRVLADRVYISPDLARYIVSIVAATRDHPDLVLGCSPRGSIAMFQICRAYALARGRGFVIPDDVKYLAPYVLSHRLSLSREARIRKIGGKDIIDSILSRAAVPKGEGR